jgi:hypothetical protein
MGPAPMAGTWLRRCAPGQSFFIGSCGQVRGVLVYDATVPFFICPMDRSKFVAIITGVISLLLAVGYLVLVQLLDFRGEMIPAPVSVLLPGGIIGGLSTAWHLPPF